MLLSVFVPVAFIPGISGELFRQFAVAVSVSMIISAINALTLSPALCAVFLRAHHGPKRGPIGYVLRGIDKARDGYALVVRKTRAARGVRPARAARGAWRGAGWLFKITPTGFLPSEDQGAVFAEVQLPEGASVNRTEAVVKRVEEIARNTPGVASVTSVVGFSLLDSLTKSNSALMILLLKPFDERKDPALRRQRHHRQADGPVPGDPGGDRLRLQPAADHRARHRLGLRIPAPEPRRRDAGRDRGGGARPGVRRQPESRR